MIIQLRLTCKACGHMHFSGVLISISVPDVITLPSFCTFSVASGHKPASLFPYFPYWTNSMEMVVPRGQVNWRYSLSQPARWYVRNVPDSSAGREGLEKEKKKLYWFIVLKWVQKLSFLIVKWASKSLQAQPSMLFLFMSDLTQKERRKWSERGGNESKI